MSYDVSLTDPVTHETIEIDHNHFMFGGTYNPHGTNELWLNITYNYYPVFRKVFGEDGIRYLYGKSGIESIPIIENAIGQLTDETASDYWTCTEGNVKQVLYKLLSFAQMRPDGIWNGD